MFINDGISKFIMIYVDGSQKSLDITYSKFTLVWSAVPPCRQFFVSLPLSGEKWSIQRHTCSSINLSTTNSTWTCMGQIAIGTGESL